MRSLRFEITRNLLSLLGFLILGAIAVRLIGEGYNTFCRGLGWGLLFLLLLGLAAVLRPRKK